MCAWAYCASLGHLRLLKQGSFPRSVLRWYNDGVNRRPDDRLPHSIRIATAIFALSTSACLGVFSTADLGLHFNKGFGYIIENRHYASWVGDTIIDSVGRIVTVGTVFDATGAAEGIIWRRVGNGSLDTSWGNGTGYIIINEGAATTAGFPFGPTKWEQLSYIHETSDGNYLLLGDSKNAAGGNDNVMRKISSVTGLHVTDFGTAGVVIVGGAGTATIPIGQVGAAKYESPRGLGVDSSGRIYVSQRIDPAGERAAALLRYSAAGVLDTANYGAPDGYYANQVNSYNGNAARINGFQNMILKPDGTAYIIGWSANAAGAATREPFALRITPAGILDPTYGTGGVALINATATGICGSAAAAKQDFPSNANSNSAALDSSNRLIIIGWSQCGAVIESVVWAMNAAGTALDSSFGNQSGYTTFDLGGLGINGSPNATKFDRSVVMRIGPDGSIYVAGYSKNAAVRNAPYLMKLSRDGILDTSFGTNGVLSFVRDGDGVAGASAATKDDLFSALTIDRLNRFLLSGTSNNATGQVTTTLWRFSASAIIND